MVVYNYRIIMDNNCLILKEARIICISLEVSMFCLFIDRIASLCCSRSLIVDSRREKLCPRGF